MNTESETAVRSPHPADSGAGDANAHPRVRTRARGTADPAPATDGDRWRGLLDRWVREFTPPEPWQHRPASLAAMSRYARYGGWAGSGGPVRIAGVWWYRLVALPVCLVTHYTAWLVARPSRTLTAAVVVALTWLALR